VVAASPKESQKTQEQHTWTSRPAVKPRFKHHTRNDSTSSRSTFVNLPVDWLLGHCDDGKAIMLGNANVLGHAA
jgi:hypothetical protein